MANPNELVVVEVQCYAETDKAILVGEPGQKTDSVYKENNQHWLPSSLINHSDLNGVGTVGEIEIPRWLAIKEELIDEDE